MLQTKEIAEDVRAGDIGLLDTSPSLLRRLHDPRSRVGVEEAWTELVCRYGTHIYQWCLRWKARPTDAADVTQEVLLRLVRRLPQFNYD